MTGEPGQSTPLNDAARLAVEILRRPGLWPEEICGEDVLARAARAANASAGDDKATEVTIVLTGDDEIRELNKRWAGKDRPTDVLSFPAEDGEASLGDIVLAYETLARDAADAGLPLPAHASHLVIHGMLHLLGYDHDDDASAREMEALETEILAGLGLHDPYREPATGPALVK